MAMQQSQSMISSGDVNGTDVFSTNGEKVGHIDHLMIDRQSGKVAFAVMNFGGFLGIGQDEHPIPWNALKYDTAQGGYVTGITNAQLDGAPQRTDAWSDDRAWQERNFRYYQADPYWL